MARLLRFSSGRFQRRTDYFYPEARAERPRVSQRDLPISGHADDEGERAEGTARTAERNGPGQ